MDLHTTPDQEQLIEAAASYLRGELPAERLPQASPGDMTPDQWRGLAEMGWFTVGLSEASGGLGLSVVEEALVMREFGRQAAPPSVLATTLALHAATELGDCGLIGDLVDGKRRACFGVREAAGGLRLLDTAHADLVLLWAHDGVALAARDDCPNQRDVPCIDASIGCVITDPPVAVRPVSSDVTGRATLLAAAWLVGGGEATCAMAAEYAAVRHQFGKPIGAFQAIAHKCAKMAIGCEQALSLMEFAAVCARDSMEGSKFHVSAARMMAAMVAYDNAVDTMQVFGGYGQTYDYLPHFYLKQALVFGLLGGGISIDTANVMSGDSIL